MKRIILSIVLTLLLVFSVASVSMVQACKQNDNYSAVINSSEIVAAGHWTVNSPAPGGWIFATLTREQGCGQNAYLYVSGFHPFGPTGETLTGSSANAQISISGNTLTAKATINFLVTGNGPTPSYVSHDVVFTWTLIASSANKPSCKSDVAFSDTSATAQINIEDSIEHAPFASSDWATIALLKPQQEVALAHVITNVPVAGGWVFAAAGKSDNHGKDGWLYVAGYHPAGMFGPTSPATLFEGINTDVQIKETKTGITVSTATINFAQIPSSPMPASHTVSVVWTITNQPKTHCNWKTASADININLGTDEHPSDVSTSSWAIVDMQNNDCWR